MRDINTVRWVLASGSPRRRELLGQIGVVPEIHPSHVKEQVSSQVPEEVVVELSAQKAEDVAAWLRQQAGGCREATEPGAGVKQGQWMEEKCDDGTAARDAVLVLGADTVVAVDGMILGKPATHQEAYEMIHRLQGRTHQVYTGVTMIFQCGDKVSGVSFAEKTDVHVFPMTEDEIWGYVSTDDPMDKAGAYGIQGIFAKYVAGIHGDYNNVVGLPVGRVYQEWKTLLEQEEQYD